MKGRRLIAISGAIVVLGLGVAACGGGPSPQATAVQILQTDGYTNSDASVTNAGLPADVTGFALSLPGTGPYTLTTGIQEQVMFFNNTANAQAAYDALNTDIDNNYGGADINLVTSLEDNNLAVVLDGSETYVGDADYDTSNWMSAGATS